MCKHANSIMCFAAVKCETDNSKMKLFYLLTYFCLKHGFWGGTNERGTTIYGK